MNEKPYTPETLAERWGCSAEKVRVMFHNAELDGFRLGKLIRIHANEVERYECARLSQSPNISSSSIEENMQLRSDADRTAADIRLARMIRA